MKKELACIWKEVTKSYSKISQIFMEATINSFTIVDFLTEIRTSYLWNKSEFE